MTDDPHVPQQRPGSHQASSDERDGSTTVVEERGDLSSRGESPTAADEEKEQEQDASPKPENTGRSDNGDDNRTAAATTASPGAWQAIYSPQYNTYYFYNAETQETTWTNPLAPSSGPASASASDSPEPDAQQDPMAASSIDPRYAAMQQAAVAQGIDPALAYLDPSLGPSMPSTSAAPGGIAFSAKFNARTGQFTRQDGRDPTHLSEYERMKRMSQFYFDVNAWEQQLSEQGGSIQGEEATKKRKRPSKKDLERFKEQKRLKKIAKTAWLRT